MVIRKQGRRKLLKCNYCGLTTNRIRAHIRQCHRKQYKLEITNDPDKTTPKPDSKILEKGQYRKKE